MVVNKSFKKIIKLSIENLTVKIGKEKKQRQIRICGEVDRTVFERLLDSSIGWKQRVPGNDFVIVSTPRPLSSNSGNTKQSYGTIDVPLCYRKTFLAYFAMR